MADAATSLALSRPRPSAGIQLSPGTATSREPTSSGQWAARLHRFQKPRAIGDLVLVGPDGLQIFGLPSSGDLGPCDPGGSPGPTTCSWRRPPPRDRLPVPHHRYGIFPDLLSARRWRRFPQARALRDRPVYGLAGPATRANGVNFHQLEAGPAVNRRTKNAYGKNSLPSRPRRRRNFAATLPTEWPVHAPDQRTTPRSSASTYSLKRTRPPIRPPTDPRER